MRRLNAEQKKLLKEWVVSNRDSLTIFVSVEEDVPYDLLEEVKEINDFETLHQDVQRYCSDLVSSGV